MLGADSNPGPTKGKKDWFEKMLKTWYLFNLHIVKQQANFMCHI